MSGGELTVATLNLENGQRTGLLPDLAAQVAGIDVLLLQEARAFDFDGQRQRFQTEALLASAGLDRSFLTRSTRGLLHEMVFVRSARVRPVAHFTPDLPDVFHDQVGWVQVRVAGLEPVLHLRSAQWAHWNGDMGLTGYPAASAWPGTQEFTGARASSLEWLSTWHAFRCPAEWPDGASPPREKPDRGRWAHGEDRSAEWVQIPDSDPPFRAFP